MGSTSGSHRIPILIVQSFGQRKRVRNEEERVMMEKAEEELERRSKFLNSLILRKKAVEQKQQQQHHHHDQRFNVRVRASDMAASHQSRAFRCARDNLDSMPSGKLDSKRLALALKKVLCFFYAIYYL